MIKTIIVVLIVAVATYLLWQYVIFPKPLENEAVTTAIRNYIMESMNPSDFGVSEEYKRWEIKEIVLHSIKGREGSYQTVNVTVKGLYMPRRETLDSEQISFSKKMDFFIEQGEGRIIVESK